MAKIKGPKLRDSRFKSPFLLPILLNHTLPLLKKIKIKGITLRKYFGINKKMVLIIIGK